ncbi:hypothetical protein J1782_01300 [Rahnella sp. BCC 1045]|jgi:hypothetical protein|nr:MULTISPECIES: hypothetical protein [unclassified Rahnella]MBU9818525.1 hypothetical protein [Rahnella sp. BCC 1045]MCS3424300.1 hypothetical protein [Rahnella sp. BIGb0603]
MATEYYLRRRLEVMMADPRNWDYSYSSGGCALSKTSATVFLAGYPA